MDELLFVFYTEHADALNLQMVILKTQLIKSIFLLFTFTRRVRRDWIFSLCFPVGGLVGREWQCYCVKKQPLQDPAV